VAAGVARHGYDLELRRSNGRGWRAVFLPERFVQQAARYALGS
jgi:hypothetical protein